MGVLMKLVGEDIWQWTCLGESWCQKENIEKHSKLCHCHLKSTPCRNYKEMMSKGATHLICWQQREVVWRVRYNIPLRWRITRRTCVSEPKPIYGTHDKYELTKMARKQPSHSTKRAKSNMQQACIITIQKLLNCRRTHVKKNPLDAQFILSIFRQPLRVFGVSRPIIRRYNRMYTTTGIYYSF